MDQRIENWVSNLNIFGTDIEPSDIQEMLDNEHAKADPAYAKMLEDRQGAAGAATVNP